MARPIFFATLIIISQILQKNGYLTHSITKEHYHDLGKFLFCFIFFWGYVGFALHRLSAGEAMSGDTGAREVCLVVVQGRAKIVAAGAVALILVSGGSALAQSPAASDEAWTKSDVLAGFDPLALDLQGATPGPNGEQAVAAADIPDPTAGPGEQGAASRHDSGPDQIPPSQRALHWPHDKPKPCGTRGETG